MTRLSTFCTLFLLLIGGVTWAQTDKCSFDQQLEQAKESAVFRQQQIAYERFVQQYAETANARSGGTFRIPCVVHILHTGQAVGTKTATGANPSNAQIQSAIYDMNDAFKHQGVYNAADKNGTYDAATNVEFVLAQRKPDGSATNGIIRYDVSSESWGTTFANNGMDAGETPGVPQLTITQSRYWPPSDYMNIWIVHEIENDTETLGFAAFPKANRGATDGLTMLASAFGYDPTNMAGYLLDTETNLNGTCNHEIGHYFSLYHTFTGDANGSTCPADLICGTNGDCCADTPPHKRTDGCPATGNTNTCVDNNGNDGPNIYIRNFMDYANDACFHGFSENQKTRMEAALAGPRNSLCASVGDEAPAGSYPSAANTSTVTDPDEAMGIYDVVLHGTTFKSLSSYHDGGYLNRVASQPTVDLDHGGTYTINIQVGVGNTGNDELAAAYIDYNSDGDFDDQGERLGISPPGSGKKNGATHSFTFTTPVQGTSSTGTRLRMRIITDFDDGVAALSSTTQATQGGQIEDYSVRLLVSLPVDLTVFEAYAVDDKSVNVNWTTASEVNSSHFEVERSKDGRSFRKIETIESAGSSSARIDYSIVDSAPLVGISYYRLKQVDVDGVYTYSPTRRVQMGTDQPTLTIYPNPTYDAIFVDGIADREVVLTIMDQLGKVLQVQPIVDRRVDVGHLPAGIYYLQFTAPHFNHVERVVIKD